MVTTRNVLLSVLVALGSTLAGCSAETASEEMLLAQDETDEVVGETSEALTTYRADQVAELSLQGATWGDYRQAVYCNPGFYAVGYRMRVEASQGDGDDTALNSVKLLCKHRDGRTEWISSHDGYWGNWYGTSSCSNGYLSGARLKVEAPQGRGDDTGANDAQFTCSGGGTVAAEGGGKWGSWYDWSTCPARSAVCGISVKIEGKQGDGDDTAMDGMKLYCCSL